MEEDAWWRFETLQEFQTHRSKHEYEFQRRWQIEQALAKAGSVSGAVLPGRCAVCDHDQGFEFFKDANGEVNFREQLRCGGCGLIARQRVVLQMLTRLAFQLAEPRIYLTEQLSPLYAAVRQRWRRVQGSEYVPGNWLSRVKSIILFRLWHRQWVNIKDVTALTFDDASLDVVISCDVLEHVPDYELALCEMARVLRPGGQLLLTVPFAHDAAETRTRAQRLHDGSIEHLEPPEYHGDPVNPGGVLAFYNFGWDLLEAVRSAGFARASWTLPWQPEQGLVGALWTLRAIR